MTHAQRIVFPVVLALLATTLHGCAGNSAAKTNDTHVKSVSYAQLVDMLNIGEKDPTVLVDVRPEQRYATGHIPGAINIPLPRIKSGDPRLAEAKNIVVYAGGWTDDLALAGAKRLLALGYKNVFEFRGGVELWQSEGRAIESAGE